jgi:hypothetical protein
LVLLGSVDAIVDAFGKGVSALLAAGGEARHSLISRPPCVDHPAMVRYLLDRLNAP